MMESIPEAREKILLEEYHAITEMHKHFDNMNLSMMSTVIAGVFVLWGVLLGAFSPDLTVSWIFMIVINWLVFFVLSGWIRYMSIHRGIIVRKLIRSHQIEKALNMEQNLIFRDDDRIKQSRNRPGAHMVELGIYLILVTLGCVVTIGLCLHECGTQQVSPFILIIFLSLLPVFVALYWAIICRVEVAQVIPFYRLPDNKFLSWFLVVVGHYKDLNDELDQGGPNLGSSKLH